MKNSHNKTTSKIDRSDDRISTTGEVFTPMDLVYQMIDDIPVETMKNPDSKFIDNSAGSGNFLYGLLEKLSEYHDRQHILDNMLYCVEYMEDNHKEICERLGVSTSHPHYVCHDALTYDYSFGEAVGLEMFM